MARPGSASMRDCNSQLSPRDDNSLISANMSSQSSSCEQVRKARRPSCSTTRSSSSGKPSSDNALSSARREATRSVVTCRRRPLSAGSFSAIVTPCACSQGHARCPVFGRIKIRADQPIENGRYPRKLHKVLLWHRRGQRAAERCHELAVSIGTSLTRDFPAHLAVMTQRSPDPEGIFNAVFCTRARGQLGSPAA